MDAPQMLRHCAEALRMSLGEIHPRPLGSDARALERDGAAVWVVGPDDDG
jgi:hypothetical protein